MVSERFDVRLKGTRVMMWRRVQGVLSMMGGFVDDWYLEHAPSAAHDCAMSSSAPSPFGSDAMAAASPLSLVLPAVPSPLGRPHAGKWWVLDEDARRPAVTWRSGSVVGLDEPGEAPRTRRRCFAARHSVARDIRSGARHQSNRRLPTGVKITT